MSEHFESDNHYGHHITPANLHSEDIQTLLNQGCDDPDCKGKHTHNTLIVHCRHHKKSPTWTVFGMGKTSLIVICAKCEAQLACVEIASRNPEHKTLTE
jgi:hypothetical protein